MRPIISNAAGGAQSATGILMAAPAHNPSSRLESVAYSAQLVAQAPDVKHQSLNRPRSQFTGEMVRDRIDLRMTKNRNL
jgi:hypothetical protein